MSKTFTIHQPMMFPPIYLMARFASVKDLIFLTTDYAKSDGWHTRFKLQSSSGEMIIPVWLKNRTFKRITDLQFDRPERMFEKLYRTLQQLYSKEPYYHDVIGLLELLQPSWGFSGYATGFIKLVLDYLEIPVQLHIDEGLNVERPDSASEWLVKLGTAINGTEYLCADDAHQKYLDLIPFYDANMYVRGQKFHMCPYGPLGKHRVTDATTSILDLLMRCSPEEVCAILRGE